MTVASRPVRSYWLERARLGADLALAEHVRLEVDGAGMICGLAAGVPAGNSVRLDGFGLPGLVDAHVHLALDGGADVVASVTGAGAAELTLRVLDNARRQLAAGVTTVRDLGSPDDLVVDLAERPWPTPAPRILAAGVVAATGGHGSFLGRTADGPTAVRRAVRTIAGGGAPWVKVFASGGVVTPRSHPDSLQYLDDELTEAVRTAHSLGLRVAAHAHSAAGILAAVAAGVDSVEHCSHATPEVIAACAEATSTLVSTLVATERFVAADDLSASRPDVVDKILAHVPHERAGLDALLAAGLEVVGATDAGTTHNPHGGGLAEQTRLLAAHGMATLAALRAVTVAPARLLDLPVGRLAEGCAADVVTYPADPVERLDVLDEPLRVVRAGADVTGACR